MKKFIIPSVIAIAVIVAGALAALHFWQAHKTAEAAAAAMAAKPTPQTTPAKVVKHKKNHHHA